MSKYEGIISIQIFLIKKAFKIKLSISATIKCIQVEFMFYILPPENLIFLSAINNVGQTCIIKLHKRETNLPNKYVI